MTLRQWVSETDDLTVVYGSSGTDTVRIIWNDRLTINGAHWALEADSNVRIVGQQGEDSIYVTLNSDPQSVRLNGMSLFVTDGQSQLVATEFERGHVWSDGDESDRVAFDGSARDDLVYSYADRLVVAGRQLDQTFEFSDFAIVSVNGGAGGHDTIHLYDSPQHDRLFVHPHSGRFERSQRTTSIDGFERISVYSTRGGSDAASISTTPRAPTDILRSLTGRGCSQTNSATMLTVLSGPKHMRLAVAETKHSIYDSRGHDRFFAQYDRSHIEGNGFYNYVFGFRRVDAYAIRGGNDKAYFYDSVQHDRFEAHPNRSWMTGPGFLQLWLRLSPR